MNPTIQQITQRFSDLLPENKQYYRLNELQAWGFPSFLIQRIKIELERNLADSLDLGQTDWADINSERVQTAWQQFVIAIHEEARLPAGYAKAVIETAIADVLEMLAKPRKIIPAVIYGTDQELTYRQLCSRMDSIVVYRHFARLLPRYMEKKEFETLPKSRCVAIIKKADQKLTAHYSPLNWAQMLEPFFKLTGEKIDTNLLRLFFEDKDESWIARQFDLINSNLSRSEVIEVLSSPDALNLEGEEYKEDVKQPENDKSLSPQKQKQEETEGIKTEEAQKEEMYEKNRPSEELEESVDEEEENNLNTIFAENEDTDTETHEEKPESDYSLNDIFFEEESGEELEGDIAYDNEEIEYEDIEYDYNHEKNVDIEPEDRGEGKKEEDQKLQNDQPNQKKEELETTDSEKTEWKESAGQPEEESSLQAKEKGVKIESLALPDEADEEETPMWMRYMSSDEILGTEQNTQEEDANKDQKLDDRSEKRAKIDDAGFIDDPLIGLSPKEASEKEVNRLNSLLATHKQLFVEEIFQGSERAFDKAVEEVAPYDSWRDASNYIRKNIFERNQVDMYSEPAVDFTDRLQTYFLEKTVV